MKNVSLCLFILLLSLRTFALDPEWNSGPVQELENFQSQQLPSAEQTSHFTPAFSRKNSGTSSIFQTNSCQSNQIGVSSEFGWVSFIRDHDLVLSRPILFPIRAPRVIPGSANNRFGLPIVFAEMIDIDPYCLNEFGSLKTFRRQSASSLQIRVGMEKSGEFGRALSAAQCGIEWLNSGRGSSS